MMMILKLHMKKIQSMMRMILITANFMKPTILMRMILRKIILKRNIPAMNTLTKVQKMNMTMLSTALPTESVRSGILPKKNRNMKPEKEVIHAPGKKWSSSCSSDKKGWESSFQADRFPAPAALSPFDPCYNYFCII